MIITIIVNDDFSVNFYKNENLFLYMKRKSKLGKLIGEIYNAKNELLLKVESFFWLGTKITYQNLEIPFHRKAYFFYERFIMNQKDKIELFFFFAYCRIYWNDKFIADTNVIYTFKHNLKLELHFNTNDEEQIYYSTIFFCAANLFMK